MKAEGQADGRTSHYKKTVHCTHGKTSIGALGVRSPDGLNNEHHDTCCSGRVGRPDYEMHYLLSMPQPFLG